MARETWFQSQVESYQRLKKWYLMPPCLILSIITYGSRVKWSNPGKGVAPFPTPWCSSYWKGSLWVTLDYSRQLYFFTIYTFVWVVGPIDMSIPQTCNKWCDWRQLGKNEKDKSVKLKCQTFIWQIHTQEVLVGLLVDQSVARFVGRIWSVFGVDVVCRETSVGWEVETGLWRVWRRQRRCMK